MDADELKAKDPTMPHPNGKRAFIWWRDTVGIHARNMIPAAVFDRLGFGKLYCVPVLGTFRHYETHEVATADLANAAKGGGG